MTGQGEGRLFPSAETQADSSTAFPCLLVIMQPSTLGGIGRSVTQDLHTQHVPIKGQGFFHIPGANGDVRYGSGFHRLHPSKARRLGWYGGLGRRRVWSQAAVTPALGHGSRRVRVIVERRRRMSSPAVIPENPVVSLSCRDEFPQTVGKDAP